MPAEFQTPRISVREAVFNASSPAALNNRNLLQFAIPSFAIVLVSNPGRLGGSFLEWIFIAVAAYVATVAVLILSRETFLAGENRGSKPWLTTVALLAAGLVRGFAIWAVGSSYGLISPSELVFRLYASPIFVLGAVATLAIYNASVDRHNTVVADLEREKTLLETMRSSIRERVAQQQEELLQRVKDILNPVLEQLRRELQGSDVSKLAPKLQATIENVVRPLSHEIGKVTQETEHAIEGVTKTFAVRSRGRFPTKVSAGQMIVPSLTTFGSASVSLAAAATLSTRNPALAGLVTVALCWLFTRTAQRALKNWWVTPVSAVFVVTAVMAIGTVLTGLVLAALQQSVPVSTFVQYFTMLLGLGGVGMAMQIARTQRNDAEVQMTKVLGELNLLTAQLRQELWLNRRRIATVIHGPIQSALYASAIRLSQEEFKSAKYLKAIEADVRGALQKLEVIEETESFDEVLGQIKSMWEGVIALELPPLDEPWANQIRENQVAAACFTSVIREAVSNAAKHGKASNVRVSVELAEPNLLNLEIVNDGLPLAEAAIPGFGSSILDEVALDWSLTKAPQGTLLKLSLPI